MSVSTTDAFEAYKRLLCDDDSPYEIVETGSRFIIIRQRVDLLTEQHKADLSMVNEYFEMNTTKLIVQ